MLTSDVIYAMEEPLCAHRGVMQLYFLYGFTVIVRGRRSLPPRDPSSGPVFCYHEGKRSNETPLARYHDCIVLIYIVLNCREVFVY